MIETLTSGTEIAMIRASQPHATQAAEKLQQSAGAIKNMAEIEEAAKEFEAVFMAEMLKPMFAGMSPDPTFGGGHAEEIFQGMMLQEYGNVMAEKGGVGLAKHVKAELIRIQEEVQNGNK